MNYSERLKHPKWQRKRLEIMHRDNFTCVKCGTDNKMLHVHHNKYYWNRNPWDYDNEELMTLCNDCHKKTHRNKADFYKIIKILESVFNTNTVKKSQITLKHERNLRYLPNRTPDLMAQYKEELRKDGHNA